MFKELSGPHCKKHNYCELHLKNTICLEITWTKPKSTVYWWSDILLWSAVNAHSCTETARAHAGGRAPRTSGGRRWNKEDVDEAILILRRRWRRWWRRWRRGSGGPEHHLQDDEPSRISASLSLSLSLWLIKKGDVIPSEPVRAPERGRGTSAVTEVDWQAGSLIKGATSVTEMRVMWMEMYGC